MWAMGANRLQVLWLLVRETRLGLLAAVMAGFGAAISEVGASMQVGGNLAGETRVLTTATVLETGRGNFEVAIALSLVLVVLAFLVQPRADRCAATAAGDVSARGDVHSGSARAGRAAGRGQRAGDRGARYPARAGDRGDWAERIGQVDAAGGVATGAASDAGDAEAGRGGDGRGSGADAAADVGGVPGGVAAEYVGAGQRGVAAALARGGSAAAAGSWPSTGWSGLGSPNWPGVMRVSCRAARRSG